MNARGALALLAWQVLVCAALITVFEGIRSAPAIEPCFIPDDRYWAAVEEYQQGAIPLHVLGVALVVLAGGLYWRSWRSGLALAVCTAPSLALAGSDAAIASAVFLLLAIPAALVGLVTALSLFAFWRSAKGHTATTVVTWLTACLVIPGGLGVVMSTGPGLCMS